ncbi:MAG TPA: redoxin family protein [Anaerolineales bacterium]|nr:redoxin family protein [Anaerolineales bacterium]
MYIKNPRFYALFIVILISLLLGGCRMSPASAATSTQVSRPDWFSISLTDAQTGKTFTINDFAGKVVLLETMAMWCPNCLFQANEVRKLHKLLGNPDDLISVSLDVDLNEDEDALREYVQEFGFEWRFAVAPLLVDRALGNLYSAEYLNPPLSPMMIIDRDGNVHHLEYGEKDAETLKKDLEPYLTP